MKKTSYKKALELAREELKTLDGEGAKALKRIFPELNESEDERIRKEIIDFLWKEKIFLQEVHSSSVENNPKYRFVMDAIAWLEKQGEKPKGKSTPKAVKEENQNCVNRVEPKFHEGDWIIRNNRYTGIPIQVIEFKGYYCCDLNGEVVNLTPNDVHNNFHSWTLDDAQDGNVLVCEGKEYLLFKSFSNTDGKIKLYCWYNGQTNNFHLSVDTKLRKEANICPATKEQCNTLLKAMTNAGYTFDFEKKKLKKIEFEPDDIIEESYQQQADDLIDMVTENSAWSVEDEKMYRSLHNLIYVVQDCDCDSMRKNELSDWFKSIKQRIGGKK